MKRSLPADSPAQTSAERRANAVMAIVAEFIALGISAIGPSIILYERWTDLRLDHGGALHLTGIVTAVTPSQLPLPSGLSPGYGPLMIRRVRYEVAGAAHEIVYGDTLECYGGRRSYAAAGVCYLNQEGAAASTEDPTTRDLGAVARARAAQVGDKLPLDVLARDTARARLTGTSWASEDNVFDVVIGAVSLLALLMAFLAARSGIRGLRKSDSPT